LLGERTFVKILKINGLFLRQTKGKGQSKPFYSMWTEYWTYTAEFSTVHLDKLDTFHEYLTNSDHGIYDEQVPGFSDCISGCFDE